MLLFLPETGTPRARGVDKADAHYGRFSWLQNPFAHISICRSPNVVLAVSIFLPLGISPSLIIAMCSAWQEPLQ